MFTPIYLRFWKTVVQRITGMMFRVNNGCGNGTGRFEVKVEAEGAKFTYMS